MFLNSEEFSNLPNRFKALVCIAVLIDGREASFYLNNDDKYGQVLGRIADKLSGLVPEFRMPLIGTQLRESIEQLSKEES
jgi:hypothetical protein